MLFLSGKRWRRSDDPGKGNLKEADAIRRAFAKCSEKELAGLPKPAKSIFHAIREAIDRTRAIAFTGDPDVDWVTVRKALEESACPRMREIADEVGNIRLLERGTVLRQNLSQDWRINGRYQNALSTIQQAFVQEHFASSSRPERGVVVMNMHKAKGNQFDEVIIFEGWPRYAGRKIIANVDRIVRNNAFALDISQVRQNFRVSSDPRKGSYNNYDTEERSVRIASYAKAVTGAWIILRMIAVRSPSTEWPS